MRITIAAFGVALFLSLSSQPAEAVPAAVTVRIEGRTETLFEGPILTDGHNVKASSDQKAPAAGRRCNGLNNGQNPLPGPTPTAAGVDAMAILGRDFDGQWYAEPFEDYFIKRWGPDAQDEGGGEFWGLLVNDVFTEVGGCQYQLDGGDEVLWTYDAFRGRPRLGLYPAAYSGQSRPLTATAALGVPFEVEVDAWAGGGEGDSPPAPERSGSQPFEGAVVAPTTIGAGGFETVDTDDPLATQSDDGGKATFVFDDPGWHRIKATALGVDGGEAAIRSNRLDVCVPEPPADGCGALPADDQLRVPPPSDLEEEPEPEGPGDEAERPPAVGAAAPAHGQEGGARPSGAGQVRLRLGRIDRRHVAQGLVKVSWLVQDRGVGIGKWAVFSRALDRRGAPQMVRARGASATSASLRLPPGAVYQLRLSVTDTLGRSSSIVLGRVRVPG